MAKNDNLNKAKETKNDEFYTQYEDIEKELIHYEKHFKDKTVFCNCDDPYESNFCKYFLLHFNYLGLKRLICTSYNRSPVAGTQLSLFDLFDFMEDTHIKGHGFVLDIDKVPMKNGKNISDKDIDLLLRSKKVVKELKGDGDFESEECRELLKQSDIIVTNPPFSLFRKFVGALMFYDKKFLIIGNLNATKYKEIFPYIVNNKLWLGVNSGDMAFTVPDYYEPKATRFWIDETGQKWRSLGNTVWLTNLDTDKRHDKIILWKKYNAGDYPKYDNYNAIEVSKVSDIPTDYKGIMGVPITFLAKHNPEQFKIVGKISNGKIKGKSVYERILIRNKDI